MSSASKNLGNQKHFESIWLLFPQQNHHFCENQFSDLLFDQITGYHVRRIHNQAFGKTANILETFDCSQCLLEDAPPTFDLWKAISQLTNVKEIILKLNVNEIRENQIYIKNGYKTKLETLKLVNTQKMTIKSGAFENLLKLEQLKLSGQFDKFERGAFNLMG